MSVELMSIVFSTVSIGKGKYFSNITLTGVLWNYKIANADKTKKNATTTGHYLQ